MVDYDRQGINITILLGVYQVYPGLRSDAALYWMVRMLEKDPLSWLAG